MRGELQHLAVVLALLIVGGGLRRSSGDEGEFIGDYSKLSGIIIPGFASTQLRAWSFLDCSYSPFDFNPLDLVWLHTAKVTLHFCRSLLFICVLCYETIAQSSSIG